MSLFVRYVPTGLSGGGGGSNPLTVGTIDSQTPSANALTIATNVLYAQSASGTAPGMVNLTTQTFLGQKTFTTGLTGTLTGAASLNVLTSALGNLTDAGTDGIVITGGTGAVVGSASLAQHVADTTHNGYLSSVDWNTFNGKQAAGNYITALTGDGTAAGPGSAALTFATVNSNVGSFTPAAITVNAKGLVTAASNATTGNLTDAGTDGIVITGGTGAVLGSGTSLAQTKSDTTHNGYLSSVDWNTFNGKQATVTIGSFNGTSTANGLDITSNAIALHAADGTNPGAVSTTTQTFAGAKTFSADVTATSAATNGLHLNLTSTDTGGKNWQWISTGSANTGGAGQFALINITDSSSVYTLKFSAAGAATFAGAVTTGALTASSYVADMTVTGASTSGSSFYLNNTKSWRLISTGSANTGGAGQLGIVNATDDGANYKVVISAAGVVTFTNAPVMTALTASQVVVTDSGKSLTSLPYATTPAASTLAEWDASKNIRGNIVSGDLATTVTAAGTTTLTIASKQNQQFTGTTTQTVVLPDATTMVIGQSFIILNRSTGIVTVNANGGGLIQTMVGGSQATITVVTVGTAAGTWDSQYTVAGIVAAVNPTVQKFTSGTSQTYTTPSGVQYIRVRIVGGGGGGGSSGTAATNSGGTGGTSTFGTSMFSCVGGLGGNVGSGAGGTGGTATLGTGPIGTAIQGGTGGAGVSTIVGLGERGGDGAPSPFGGQGAGGFAGVAGVAAIANSGSGGGGGGENAGAGGLTGPGGGAGGYAEGIITSPAATYIYTVGGAGTAGGAGTGGTAGAAGGAGYVEVTEFYTNFSVGTTSTVAAGTFLAGPTSGSAAVPTFRALQAPTIQKFTSGSGTYTTASGALYLRVKLVGGGGGSSASGISASGGSNNGSTGGDTTFGNLTGSGGLGGTFTGAGGNGGATTIGSGWVGAGHTGGTGGTGGFVTGAAAATTSEAGGGGGTSFYGGVGNSGTTALVGMANTGQGGGGPATQRSGVVSDWAGSGGGSGGFLEAVTTGAPSATYAYGIGAGGAAGPVATNGAAGVAGGTGYVEVWEYYQ